MISMCRRRRCLLIFLCTIPVCLAAAVQVPVVVATNTTVPLMAANLSSGNFQRYESFGLDILKGLKPDVVAIQEFNYASTTLGTNTAAALREMIDQTFGTNFAFFRQSGAGITISNGVISRFPILDSGVWDDIELPDRDFVWARLKPPGSIDLYVVSVHLKASSADAATRAREASALKTLIQTNFPAGAFVIVAGDFNISAPTEAALTTFKTFLSDDPIPTDATSGGDADTNAGRTQRYDYVLPNSVLDTNRVATVIGSQTFSNGLVFDSRVFTPLTDVAPVQSGDSGATGMQHMGVIKDFRITYTVTNLVDVVPPRLTLLSTNILNWIGQSNVVYTVQSSLDLTFWFTNGAAASSTTNFFFTNSTPDPTRTFYRLSYP